MQLPIVRLCFDRNTGALWDDDEGDFNRAVVSRLYYADRRLKEYRSIDGAAPWIVKASQLSASMDDIIEQCQEKRK